MKNKALYIAINILVVSSSILFFAKFNFAKFNFKSMSIEYIAILLVTAFCIYFLKAVRLYFLLVGEGICLFKYVGTFSKTFFVSIILPFKIGEIFKIYNFGILIKNFTKSFAVILIDRLVDILALLSTFVLMKFFAGLEIPSIAFALIIFAAFIISLYMMMPAMLSYWKNFVLQLPSSRRHLRLLYFIENTKKIYTEIQSLISGRFFAIYAISIVAWMIEIAHVFLSINFIKVQTENIVANYLNSALTGKYFLPLANFVSVSMAMLAFIFALCSCWALTVAWRKNGKR